MVTPPTVQSVAQMQGGVFVMPTSVHGTYSPGLTGQAILPSVQAASLQTVMSRLGYGNLDGYSFPDVSLLKSAPQSFTSDSELVDKSLAGSWARHNDSLQSQVSLSVVECIVWSYSLRFNNSWLNFIR